ncbi:MAG TPA: FKBP-type peptidyl-prolyl cis-trans isomerase [Steroidobacter sp.]|jgi:FKBP-type peptidyl-prolyl cis-trans isomerase|nr:FKBP-type peptidyl-prolyl cis-trans isomerase [Steroidobacter sp.]
MAGERRTLKLIVGLCSMLLSGACARDAPHSERAPFSQPTRATATELQKMDIVQGTGEGVSSGRTAVVHYTGWLYEPTAEDGKGAKFDSSRDSGQPFRFKVGAGEVIKGWDEGVQGMQAGGRRRLVMPPQLGYGERGAGGGAIPPNATLLFDIELLAIE